MAKIITLLFITLKKQYKFNKILLAYSGIFEFFDTIFVVSLIHAVLTLAAAALQNKNQSPLYGRVTKKYGIYQNFLLIQKLSNCIILNGGCRFYISCQWSFPSWALGSQLTLWNRYEQINFTQFLCIFPTYALCLVSAKLFWKARNAHLKGCVKVNRNLTLHRILTFLNHDRHCIATRCDRNAMHSGEFFYQV